MSVNQGLLCASAFVTLAIGGPPTALASAIVGNMTSTNNAAGTFFDINTQLAAPFTLGAGFTPKYLESLTLRLSKESGSSTMVRVSLWSDNNSLPDSQLLVVGEAQLLLQSYLDFTFWPQSAVTLQPGMNYWVVLEKTSGTGIVRWRGVGPGGMHMIDPGSDPFADIPASVRGVSTDGGESWSLESSPEHLFSVRGATIPAPSAAAALGLAGFVAVRRRR